MLDIFNVNVGGNSHHSAGNANGSVNNRAHSYRPSRGKTSPERKLAEQVVNALDTRMPFSYSSLAYAIMQSGADINVEFLKVISAYLEAQAERVFFNPEVMDPDEYTIAIQAARIVDALNAFKNPS